MFLMPGARARNRQLLALPRSPNAASLRNNFDLSFTPNYLSGLAISNDTTTPNTVLDIAAGVCTDSTNSYLMKIPAMTKSTSTFSPGTGNGGMSRLLTFTNTVIYGVYVILLASGATDVYFDTGNFFAPPGKPLGTIAFRRIGYFRAAVGPLITPFTQVNDAFYWTVPVRDVTTQNIGTTATDFVLSIPANTTSIIVAFGFVSAATSSGRVYPKFMTDQTVAYGTFANVFDGSAGGGAAASLQVPLDANSTLRARGGAVGWTVDIVTQGWIDSRGK